MQRRILADARFWGLAIALLLVLVTFVVPRWPLRQPVYSTLFVIDITRSMNVADYRANGEPVTRLARAKQAVSSAIARLPCGSRAGIALFTERTINITLMPVEVCSSFNALQASVEMIDWRMAWAADSNVNRGLIDGMEKLLSARDDQDLAAYTSLVFLTDGHEAPPTNPRYEPDPALLVPGKKPDAPGAVSPDAAPIHGLIAGVGGYTPVEIPKFNPEGERIGVYEADDVSQAANFGQPADPDAIEGYVPRNAPWGRNTKSGDEHLSAVREAHLQAMAGKADFDYVHLEDDGAFFAALTPRDWADIRERPSDIRWLFAALALLLVSLVHLTTIFIDLRRAAQFKPRAQRPRRSTK